MKRTFFKQIFSFRCNEKLKTALETVAYNRDLHVAELIRQTLSPLINEAETYDKTQMRPRRWSV
jgi:hypothetical protein